jgi:hypothetical protein
MCCRKLSKSAPNSSNDAQSLLAPTAAAARYADFRTNRTTRYRGHSLRRWCRASWAFRAFSAKRVYSAAVPHRSPLIYVLRYPKKTIPSSRTSPARRVRKGAGGRRSVLCKRRTESFLTLNRSRVSQFSPPTMSASYAQNSIPSSRTSPRLRVRSCLGGRLSFRVFTVRRRLVQPQLQNRRSHH